MDIPEPRAPEPGARAARAVPMLGAHVLLWQPQHRGVNPAVSAPIATQPRGSAFLVFNAGYSDNTRPPRDSEGNSWTALGEPVVFRGYHDLFDVKAWVALDGRGGPAHTVGIDKAGPADGEISVPFIEIRNADVLQDMVQTYPAEAPSLRATLAGLVWPSGRQPVAEPGAPPASARHLTYPFGATVTSGRVTTTGPALLVAAWFGDAYAFHMTAVPDNGFTVIERLVELPPESAVQCVVAYRQVAEAGTWQVSWTESPNQGAVLWLLAFQSSGSG
ncbi:MAG: hypothetical protein GXC76_14885 [Rhodanobacteraceae bacterium]|jgi:hypothetical protein|nr:hypothetical protein [Rhodanobacteraceae bacterium]